MQASCQQQEQVGGPGLSMQVIRCLLIEPYPESALNEEAGKLLLEDYSEYAQHARYGHSLVRRGSLLMPWAPARARSLCHVCAVVVV